MNIAKRLSSHGLHPRLALLLLRVNSSARTPSAFTARCQPLSELTSPGLFRTSIFNLLRSISKRVIQSSATSEVCPSVVLDLGLRTVRLSFLRIAHLCCHLLPRHLKPNLHSASHLAPLTVVEVAATVSAGPAPRTTGTTSTPRNLLRLSRRPSLAVVLSRHSLLTVAARLLFNLLQFSPLPQKHPRSRCATTGISSRKKPPERKPLSDQCRRLSRRWEPKQ